VPPKQCSPSAALTIRPSQHRTFTRPAAEELKRKSVRGGAVAVGAQGLKLVLQTGTVMLLARLLSPQDFGLAGMAGTLTGFLALFKDAGLASATIQRGEVTHEQLSTLFWINAAIGAGLTAFAIILAPGLAWFYRDSRVFLVAAVLASSFLFTGLMAQHGAIITREMRFLTQAKIDLTALVLSSATGVVMALLGWRYWSLVGMGLANNIVSVVGVWVAVPWIPGPPRRNRGVLPMLHFGGLSTLNNFLVYLAWNSQNILLGRYWGAHALGIYGRAHQLAILPVEQWTATLSGVALSGLSAVQHDPQRLSRSFLRAYSMLLSMTVPIAITCPLFADEIIRMLLGEKWMEVAPVFRLLAPTSLVFALANPLSWLVMSTGRVGRAVNITAVMTPVVIVGIVLGLSHGPLGVAIGYSGAMILILIPIAAWSKRDTGITWSDLGRVAKSPLLAGLLAGSVGLIAKMEFGGALPPILMLVLGLGLVFSVYVLALLTMGQKNLYTDLLTELFRRTRHQE
jgi:PST family polysaccharide transporter